jgi:uroporphyrinogen decarboxylase
MNRRELVKAAIAHQPAERVPYCIDIRSDAWAALADQGLTDGKTREDFIDNDVQSIEEVVPWWSWHDLAADWAEEDFPTSPAKCIGNGSYVDLATSLQELRQQNDKYFLVRIYGSHFEKAYFARGIENCLADMAGAPQQARKLLNKIIDRNMVMLENFLVLPEIDGVLLGSDWGSQKDLLMSFDTWQEMIGPGEQREYDLVHSYGKDVWVHSCGNIARLIPSLIEMKLDVLNPVQPEAMDIAVLKRDYGDQLTFWGGISTQRTLPYGTPDEVRAEARGVRDLMSQGGGYIFSPAQTIQADVPVENILALLEVAREGKRTESERGKRLPQV